MCMYALVTRVVCGNLMCRFAYTHVYVYMYIYIHTHTDKRNAQHAHWSTTCSPIGRRCNTCHTHTTPRRRSAPRTLRPARLAPLATHTYTHQHTHAHGRGGCMRWRARWRVRISILLKVPRTVHVEVGGEEWRGGGSWSEEKVWRCMWLISGCVCILFHLFSRSSPLDVSCVVVCGTVRYSVLSKRQCCGVLPCVAASPAHHAVDVSCVVGWCYYLQ